ncbi:MAG: PKD domain-containing protein [Cytophagaceae bacterium]
MPQRLNAFYRVSTSYLFKENKGQWPGQVKFKAEITNGDIYIQNNGVLYNLYQPEAHGHPHKKGNVEGESEIPKGKGHAYQVTFKGSSWNKQSTTTAPSSYYHNYLKGPKSQWANHVYSFQAVTLNNMYPGVDVKYYTQDTKLKYDFIVQPHASIKNLALQYEGADSIYLKNGHLFIVTTLGEIQESAPYAYQLINGELKRVDCNYLIKDSLVQFDFPKGYNHSYELIIDPELIFSTYSGSTGDNWGNTATYDDAGNGYAAGTLFEVGYPVTLGAYQIVYRGYWDFKEDPDYPGSGTGYFAMDPDIAIMKLSPTGSLIYATLLGGSNTEVPSSIIVNHKNELVILGVTGSSSDGGLYPFPTTAGAVQTTFSGGSRSFPLGYYETVAFDIGSDLFVTVLDPTGSTLIGSTYLGGTSNDGIYEEYDPICKNYGDAFRAEVVVDSIDQIYIATKTFSNDIAKASGSSYRGGKSDVYLAKLSADVSSVLWDNYLGGSGMDAGYSIQLNSKGEVYVAGGTNSTNFPVSVGAHKSRINFGDVDGFIAHYSPTGTLLHATYIGSVSYDQTFFVQLDKTDIVYTIGQTRGSIPMSNGVWGIPDAGQFVQKLDPTLSTLLLSTTFGSNNSSINITINAFTVTTCNKILLSGWGGNVNQISSSYVGGNTFNMPITADAYKSTTDGSDFYLMVIDEYFAGLLYATYFGSNSQTYESGDHVDGGTSRFDKKGIVYQAVCASCGGFSYDGFPTTPGVQSRTNNADNCNNALFKFDLTKLAAGFTVDKTKGCDNLIIQVTNNSVGGRTFEWDFGDGTKLSGTGPFYHRYAAPGDYKISLIVTDNTTCIGKDTSFKWINVYPLPTTPSSLQDTIICYKDTIQLIQSCDPYHQYEWSPNIEISNTQICDARFYPSDTRAYYVTITDTNNCVRKDTAIIQVAHVDKGLSWGNLTECEGLPKVQLNTPSKGPLNYLWTFGDGSSSTVKNPVHEYQQGGHYFIVLDMYNDYCNEKDTISVSVQPIKIPNLVTPNNDGKNDCFEITGIYPGWEVSIYNAWSKRIFFSENYNQQFCGENVTESVYYYLVCSPQGNCCKGWLHTIDKQQ